jgi:hypothetical protein
MEISLVVAYGILAILAGSILWAGFLALGEFPDERATNFVWLLIIGAVIWALWRVFS